MADMHSPLEQLADISEPAWHSDFDLPPVAWLALLVLLLTIGYLALRFYRRWRYFAAKREAIRLLGQLADKPNSTAEINQLLKRVLQHYQPSHPALSLPSAKWQQWLSTGHSLALPNLDRLLYSEKPEQQAVQQFYQFAQLWLKHYNGKAPALDSGGQHA